MTLYKKSPVGNYMAIPAIFFNFVSPKQLIRNVCKAKNIEENKLMEKRRFREMVIIRQCLMKIIFDNYANLSLEAIGSLLSIPNTTPYDHATVLYAKRSISEALEVRDHIVSPVWNELTAIVKNDLEQNKLHYPDKMK